MRKKIEITIETHEIWVIRRAAAAARCADCDGQLTLVTIDQAVEITGIRARAIYRRVENGESHFLETADGRLLVCLNSLPSPPQTTELQPR